MADGIRSCWGLDLPAIQVFMAAEALVMEAQNPFELLCRQNQAQVLLTFSAQVCKLESSPDQSKPILCSLGDHISEQSQPACA